MENRGRPDSVPLLSECPVSTAVNVVHAVVQRTELVREFKVCTAEGAEKKKVSSVFRPSVWGSGRTVEETCDMLVCGVSYPVTRMMFNYGFWLISVAILRIVSIKSKSDRAKKCFFDIY